MTPDWAAKPTTVPYAHYGNPQSLNLYAYVGNNPVSSVDPDGHSQDFYLQIATSPNGYSPEMLVESGSFANQDGEIVVDGSPEAEALQNALQNAAQQQTGNQLVVTPDKGAVHILPGGYEQTVDYKLDTMGAKGKVTPLSSKDASEHKVELREKLVSGSGVEICNGQCVTHGTLTDIMQVGGGRSHSVIKRFLIDDKAARIYDPGTKKAYDFVRVDASSRNPKNPFVFAYGNNPQ
jgi:hypothetical protein